MVTRKVGLQKIRLADLVEDFDCYPRHSVDVTYELDLARAIEAGIELPPPIADKQTLRIVDGFHRVRAYRRILGDTGIIEVELRHYKSESELVSDAVQLNSAHGRKLDSQDRVRSALMLERHGVAHKHIALLLHTTEKRVEELLVKIVIVNGDKKPAKPVVRPSPGNPPRSLSHEQYDISRSSSGWKTRQTVTQLIRELEGDIVDLSDKELVDAFWRLHDAISRIVPRVEEPAS